MTKKHFTLLAETLNSYSFTDPQDKVSFASRLADVLKQTNPAFNKQRFLDAALENKYSHTAGHSQKMSL